MKNILCCILLIINELPPHVFGAFLLAGGRPTLLFCRQFFWGNCLSNNAGKTQVFERPAEGKTTCLNNGEFTGEYRTILSEKCYPEMNLALFCFIPALTSRLRVCYTLF
jgi:hypothetical protein